MGYDERVITESCGCKKVYKEHDTFSSTKDESYEHCDFHTKQIQEEMTKTKCIVCYENKSVVKNDRCECQYDICKDCYDTIKSCLYCRKSIKCPLCNVSLIYNEPSKCYKYNSQDVHDFCFKELFHKYDEIIKDYAKDYTKTQLSKLRFLYERIIGFKLSFNKNTIFDFNGLLYWAYLYNNDEDDLIELLKKMNELVRERKNLKKFKEDIILMFPNDESDEED